MSKNVIVNGASYSNVSQVQLSTSNGGTALFKDVDEITQPSGTISITSNGTYDVKNYASASVNVAGGSSGGSTTAQSLLFTGNVTNGVSLYQIPFNSDWLNYAWLSIEVDFTLSAEDKLYLGFDVEEYNKSKAGFFLFGTGKATTANGSTVIGVVMNGAFHTFYDGQSLVVGEITQRDVSNINIFPCYAGVAGTVTFTGTVKIYGVK